MNETMIYVDKEMKGEVKITKEEQEGRKMEIYNTYI